MARVKQPRPDCSVDGCDRTSYGLGFCKSHWGRVRRNGDPGPATFRLPRRTDDVTTDPTQQCIVPDCERKHWARGYCPTHYRRWTRHGDVNHLTRPPRVPKPCSTEGCEDDVEARGLCLVHYQRWYHKLHPQKVEAQKTRARKHILKQYGLTQACYDATLKEQHGRCAICRTDNPGGVGGRYRSWCVDHDHVTGQTRGLLCHACNTALGLLRDDPKILRAATRYIQRYRKQAPQP